jgi:hypothetical protein
MIILLDTILHYGLPGVISQTTMAVMGFNGVFFIYLHSIGNGVGDSGHMRHESLFSSSYIPNLLNPDMVETFFVCVDSHPSRDNIPLRAALSLSLLGSHIAA